MREKFRRFMEGRYGTDKLNIAILLLGLGLSVLSFLIILPFTKILLCIASYILMGIAIFRCLSRKIYKRYRENLRFLMLLDRFKDKEHRYFICPKCLQPVRVPKGKGKISITCPKCSEKFIKKT